MLVCFIAYKRGAIRKPTGLKTYKKGKNSFRTQAYSNDYAFFKHFFARAKSALGCAAASVCFAAAGLLETKIGVL